MFFFEQRMHSPIVQKCQVVGITGVLKSKKTEARKTGLADQSGFLLVLDQQEG